MSEHLPDIKIDPELSGVRIVTVAGAEVRDIDKLVELAPELLQPDATAVFAEYANHLARGYDYEVIQDPAAFRVTYLAELEAEPPVNDDDDILIGKMRLSDHGTPDFDTMHAPCMKGATLIFFARHISLGLPYRVEITTSGLASYQPLAMSGPVGVDTA